MNRDALSHSTAAAAAAAAATSIMSESIKVAVRIRKLLSREDAREMHWTSPPMTQTVKSLTLNPQR